MRYEINKIGLVHVISNVRKDSGFTFPEILACMVFLSILIPVLLQGLSIANKGTVYAERKITASYLAESKLNELIHSGDWQWSIKQGTFEPHWQNYHWRLYEENWQHDTMTFLTIVVSYPVQNQEHTVRLSTLVSRDQYEDSQSSTL